jgi:protoporphyrinogen oxidase
MKTSYDVVIIGGGICGLTLAYRLTQKKKSVLLIEKQKDLGGALFSIKREKYEIEAFYHHLFERDRDLLNLIRDLGLSKKLHFYPAKTGFVFPGGIYELSTPQQLLRFDKISIPERIRLGFFLARILTISDPKKYDPIAAEDFIQKYVGTHVYSVFFRELLIGKFGKDYKKISAAWFITRMKLRARRTAQGEILGYLDNGFGTLIRELEKKIKGRADILLESSVEKITMQDNLVTSIVIDGKIIKTKYLVSTMPINSLLNLVKIESAEKSRSLHFQGAVNIVLGLKRPITKYYWTNIEMPGKKVRAIIEHTNFLPQRRYGEHVVYLASYPSYSSSVWKDSDEMILRLYLKDISVHTRIEEKDINWFMVKKMYNSGIVYEKNVLSRIPSIQTNITNLFIGGMSGQFPERSVNASVRQANRIVDLICRNS